MRVALTTQKTDCAPVTTFIDLPDFTIACAMVHVGKTVKVHEQDQIDSSQFHEGALMLAYAQQRPWTWIYYTFVRVG